MNRIPDPLRVVLRDFFHVEWFDIEGLKKGVQGCLPGFKVDVKLLLEQFDEALASSDLPFEEINALTNTEFESSLEASIWLSDIYKKVFQKTDEYGRM